MDHPGDTYRSVGEYPRGFWAGLQIVKGFIIRLVNLVSVTEQDLMEAGIYLRQTRD